MSSKEKNEKAWKEKQDALIEEQWDLYLNSVMYGKEGTAQKALTQIKKLNKETEDYYNEQSI